MKIPTQSNYAQLMFVLGLLLTLSLPAHLQAGTFNWGDFAGNNVMFLNVTENNDETTSLFAPEPGMGGPTVSGDVLHFDPVGFSSQSQNNSADITDSTLTTVIMANPGASIDVLKVNELGDYSLGGLTGGEANAQVGAAFFWTVLEVNNAPVSLATVTANLTVGSGAGPQGGMYSRPTHDGVTSIWQGSAMVDLNSYLATEGISGQVTKVRLRFDNALQTSADNVSTAFIKKKSVDIEVNGRVPEPGTALLLSLVLATVPTLRRR